MSQHRRAELGPPAVVPPLGSRESRRALSRHTVANDCHFAVRAEHLNAWCRIPGSPFSGSLVLLPNHPRLEPPVVTYAPIGDPGIDALTCMFVSAPKPEHANRLRLTTRVQAADGSVLAERELLMACGERAAVTLRFQSQSEGVRLSLGISFASFDGSSTFGSVRLRDLVGYADSELMHLFNAAGSDKGSEVYWGEGAPHLYALVYEPLLATLRHEPFNLLEIGLDTASQSTGQPRDAPSLRAWREYFPHATLYGYDVNDFGFLAQVETHTFQGDQAAPDDLRRFIERHSGPTFALAIDDGSHVPAHQQVSLAHLFEHVADGGFYFVEDISWTPFQQSPTTGEVLRRFAETGRIESPFIPAELARRLESTIESVVIYRPNDLELAVIRKRRA